MTTSHETKRAQLMEQFHQALRTADWMERAGFSPLREQMEAARLRDRLLALEARR